MKLRALDLFCRAGGVSVGLERAGFEVVGVDVLDMRKRHRGGRFVQGDALTYPLEGFDFIWASPPCQAHTVLRSLNPGKEYLDLIPETRERLKASGVPWVIENVPGAPLEGPFLILCGTMFGLETPDGSAELRRHRMFETSFPIAAPGPCRHRQRSTLSIAGHQHDSTTERWARKVICVGGGKAMSGGMMTPRRELAKKVLVVTGNSHHAGNGSKRKNYSTDEARHAMGIDWMAMRDLSQAIPPAYAQYIGERVKLWIEERRAPGVTRDFFDERWESV